VIYYLDMSAYGSHQTIHTETQASGAALIAEMRERVQAVITRGSGNSAAPLFSVSAYTGYGKRDIRVSAHTDAQGWRFQESGKVRV
jgi:hypothetical protein